MEELIALIARTAGTVIEGMAVLIVAFGSVDAFGRLMSVSYTHLTLPTNREV